MTAPPIFRSLRHRDYRLYIFGQLVSLTGTWMQHIAQAWLVYRLTGSSLMLGVTAFAAHIPILVFGLLGGVLADRVARRPLLMTVHALAACQALVLAALTLGGWVQVWHVIALAMLLGCLNAVEMPTRHSLVAELVPKTDLPNAIALNSGVFSGARFAGPALAGVLVVALGEGPVFVLNAASFGAVILALWRMQARLPPPGGKESPAAALAGGLRFARADPLILASLGVVLMISLFGIPYGVVLPVLVDRVLGGGADLLGLLLGTAGMGAFAASLVLARRTETHGLPLWAALAGLGAGLALTVLARSASVGVALAVMPLIGFGFTVLVAACNTLIQLQAEEQVRGRVMALFSMAFIGMTPFCHLIAGGLGEWLGIAFTLTLLGAVCMFAAALYLAAVRRLPAPG